MVEHREGTSPDEGSDFSFGADNVERGDPDVDFIKRKPTYPWGDDPRGREIDYEAADADNLGESYASKNPVFRAYQGRAPLEGQQFGAPSRVGSVQKVSDLRPALPNQSVDFAALEAAKAIERGILEATNFAALFPNVSIELPAPGASFSPGSQLEVRATVNSLRNITSATLIIDNHPVDTKFLDRRDQDAAQRHTFTFLYNISSSRSLGPMDITVRGFNINSSAQGFIADDARNNPPNADAIDIGVGTLDGRLGQSHGSQAQPPLLAPTYILRTPEGVSSISVNIV
jgi:hypothetical protein